MKNYLDQHQVVDIFAAILAKHGPFEVTDADLRALPQAFEFEIEGEPGEGRMVVRMNGLNPQEVAQKVASGDMYLANPGNCEADFQAELDAAQRKLLN